MWTLVPTTECKTGQEFFFLYYHGENEDYGWRKVDCVGVMKDKEIQVEEVEVSHTLGGSGEGRVHGWGKYRGWRQMYCSQTDTSHTLGGSVIHT